MVSVFRFRCGLSASWKEGGHVVHMYVTGLRLALITAGRWIHIHLEFLQDHADRPAHLIVITIIVFVFVIIILIHIIHSGQIPQLSLGNNLNVQLS